MFARLFHMFRCSAEIGAAILTWLAFAAILVAAGYLANEALTFLNPFLQ